MKSLGPIDYLSPVPPDGYRCMDCDTHGVKMWRMSNSSCIEFRCFTCACLQEKVKATPSVDRKGVMKLSHGIHVQSDQIGNLVPAIPSEDGSTCWGYSNASAEACQWWWSLPFYPLKRITIYTKPGNRIFLTADNALYEIFALYESEPYPPCAPGSKQINPGHYSVNSNGDVTPLGEEKGS